jgi:pimeloyl-ACP methyl ester carboxylesterase
MNAPHKHIRMLEDAGTGAPVVFLQSSEPTSAKVIEALKGDFRVVTFDISAAESTDGESELLGALSKLGPQVSLVASALVARRVLNLVVAHPDLANAVALLSPPALSAGDKALVDALPNVKPVVLAMFGTRSTANANGRRVYRQAIPKSHMMLVYDTDEHMADQRPEAVAAAIKEFVTLREGFLVTQKSAKIYP